MKKLALAVLLLAAACSTPSGSTLTRIDWRCSNGGAFSVRINAQGQAEVFAGGQLYHLQNVSGSSGARYANGSVEYVERAGEASLHGAAGGPYDHCRH